MAHFAKIEKRTGTVVDVIKVADSDTSTAAGVEKEYIGIAFLNKIFPDAGGLYDWRQTSYNAYKGKHRIENDDKTLTWDQKACFRKNYASVGGKYDYMRDAFIPPPINPNNQILNTETCQWDSHVQGNQTATNEGGPLDFTDSTNYTDNANLVPATWEWTNAQRTYVSKSPKVVKDAVYKYNSVSKEWEA
tara:strand:+ start:6283 stop:6852 length:570 start_codon:yes stop_codon:yes gene_type:complete